MTEVPNQKTIGAVKTTFEILNVLSEIEPAGVSEIAEEANVSTSTVFTHLNTLLQEKYLVKDDTTYKRSLQFLADGGAIRQQYEVAELLEEKVDKLAMETGEIAGAAVEERGQRVILYRSAGDVAVGDNIDIGNHSYMHWTSLGKAILAHLSPAKRSKVIDTHGLPRGTEQTFINQDELEDELKQIRHQGYALDNEEHLRGVRGVAVPIISANEEVICSIGITGPRNRFHSTYLSELINSLEYMRNEIEVESRYYQ